jgi:hypothetical protein
MAKVKIVKFGTISEHPEHAGVLMFKGFAVEADSIMGEQELARALITEVIKLLKIELSNSDGARAENTNYTLYASTKQ